MTPALFHELVLDPGLAALARLTGVTGFGSQPARTLLVAIAGQESHWTARRQVGGTAHSFWQFEAVGIAGILAHQATAHYASRLLIGLGIGPADAYTAVTYSDLLATGLARLLLWTDPMPLPEDETSGWRAYTSLWRPGRPREATWPDMWQQASDATQHASETAA